MFTVFGCGRGLYHVTKYRHVGVSMFTVFGCSQAYITLLSIDMWESLCLLSLVSLGLYHVTKNRHMGVSMFTVFGCS